VVDACRNLRGEMNISPAQRIPLYAQGDSAFLKEAAAQMQALAKLSEVKVFEDEATLQKEGAGAPVAIVDGNHLLLKIEIDVAAERVRLSRRSTVSPAKSANAVASCPTRASSPRHRRPSWLRKRSVCPISNRRWSSFRINYSDCLPERFPGFVPTAASDGTGQTAPLPLRHGITRINKEG
jgi:hypothetical protein